MSKEKIAIGFDLGTTSVGWSIIKINDNNPDEKLEILNMGVRLFEDPASQDNNAEKRRVARSRRRRINRLKIRKFDFFKLLKKFNLISDKEEYENIIRSSIYDEITQTYLLPVTEVEFATSSIFVLTVESVNSSTDTYIFSS